MVLKGLLAPKLEDSSDEKDMLVAWTESLKNPESEKVRNLEMTIQEIRHAKDELVRLSADKQQRRLYEIRTKMLKDETSALNKAKRDGLEEGVQRGKIESARALLDVLDDEKIANKLGLDREYVKELRDSVKS